MSVGVFGVKYSKMKHTRCIFLNIFVQDCSRQHLILLEKSADPIRCYPVINFHMIGEQDIDMKLSTAFSLRGSFSQMLSLVYFLKNT